MKQCKDCDFWVAGDCRRKSPVVITDGYETDSPGHVTVWPETKGSDGCGDFKKTGEETGDSISLLQYLMSVRLRNCLRRANITTIQQAKNKSDQELLSLKRFGHTCLRELRGRIAEYEEEKQT